MGGWGSNSKVLNFFDENTIKCLDGIFDDSKHIIFSLTFMENFWNPKTVGWVGSAVYETVLYYLLDVICSIT